MKLFRTVACAVSGGVDSSVSAYLLKQKGFDVLGIYMRNWDRVNELGVCTADKDCEDAQYVCKTLGIPFMEVNFAKEYWNDVFSYFIDAYESGRTPNPDIMCNRKIKFNRLYDYVINKLGMDALAFGHYVRTTFGEYLENFDSVEGVFLKAGKDKWKDQSFFLSQVHQKPLQRSMFPVGNLLKSDVKKLAESIGLGRIARKPESTGICFIGANNFQKFIQEYLEEKPGDVIDIDSNNIVARHNGFHFWTLGQRFKIKHSWHAWYIVKKIIKTNAILVARGTNHPSLYSRRFITDIPHWIHSKPKQSLKCYVCHFRFIREQFTVPCYISENDKGQLNVTLETPLRAIRPGQFAVFYDDDICLGSSEILENGPSLYRKENIYSESSSW